MTRFMVDWKLMFLKHTACMQDQMTHASGVLNAQFPMEATSFLQSTPVDLTPLESEEVHYTLIPQSPSDPTVQSTVTINFPEMELVSPANAHQADQAARFPSICPVTSVSN
jgi:hypothetical protein